MKRTDSLGVWSSEDGVVWTLNEPSEKMLTRSKNIEDTAEETFVDEPDPALFALVKLVVLPLIQSNSLSDSQISSLSPLFPAWRRGLDVEVGEVYRVHNGLVKVKTKHKTSKNKKPKTDDENFKVLGKGDLT